MRVVLAGLAALLAAQPVAAEVIATSENSFVTRDEAVVEANPKAVWLALISPARWWNASHTWSGDSANLTITPQAGGCFCERIPEDPDPEKITLEGSVEHMRVIQAYPERALRMQGALGPLQSEPVTGILTVAISEVEEGTKIVWEYNVGGSMRYKIGEISEAVGGVMTQQLSGLAQSLGMVSGPATASEDADDVTEEESADESAEERPEGPADEADEGASAIGDDFLDGVESAS